MKHIFLSVLALFVPLVVSAQDWSKPDLASAKSSFMTEMHSLFNQLAKMDFTSATNLPVGTIRYNAITKSFNSWDGTTWNQIALSGLYFDNESVTGGKMAQGTVTSYNIADGTITTADISASAASRLTALGPFMYTWAGSGSPTAGFMLGLGGTSTRLMIPRSFVATHMSIACDPAFTYQVTLYKNNVSTSQIILSGGAAETYGAIFNPSYAAADVMSVKFNSVTSAPSSGTVSVMVFGYFVDGKEL
jgi:hypothetical protein